MPVPYKQSINVSPLNRILGGSNKYCIEEERLETFDSRWPHSDNSLCSKENMAKAGFYYTKTSDIVKCFCCHLKLNDWDPENDNPQVKHEELSKNCIFAQFAKEEGQLTIEEWCDVLCKRIGSLYDYKLNKLSSKEQELMN